MEWKKSIKILGKSIVSILVMGFLVIAVVTAVSKILLQSQVFSPVKVAVSIPREEKLIRQVMSFVENMDSVESICVFQYEEPDVALEKLEQGQVDAVIEIPVNFYEDIYTGKNTPATLYLSGDEGEEKKLFGELLAQSVSMLQTAQAGVYATLDTAEEWRTSMDRGDLGEAVSFLYIREILAREGFFYETVASPTGWVNAGQYYGTAGFILLLLMSGVYYGFLYGKKTRAVEQKLSLYGLGCLPLSLVRVLVMTINLWVLAMGMYLAGSLFFTGKGMELPNLSAEIILGLLVLSTAIGAYFHLVYTLTNEGIQGGVLLLVMNLVMILCSGLLVPTAYLPGIIGRTGHLLPLTYWQEYSLQLLFGDVQLREMVLLLGMALIMTGLGALIKWKKQ